MKYLLGTVLALSFGMASCAAPESEPQNDSQTTSERGERPERPERGESERGERGGERGKPPQEAFDACVDKAVDAACTVVTPRGELEGMCTAGREEAETATLFCAPEGGRRPPKE